MDNLEAIKAACERLGWIFHKDKQTYKWWGHWVDDSPVPRHLFKDQAEYDRVLKMQKHERKDYMTKLLGQCQHAIQIPGVSYEIGILNQDDKLIPIWDWVDNQLHKAIGANGGIFTQAYTIERAKIEARNNGHWFTERIDEQGAVTLRVQVPSY